MRSRCRGNRTHWPQGRHDPGLPRRTARWWASACSPSSRIPSRACGPSTATATPRSSGDRHHEEGQQAHRRPAPRAAEGRGPGRHVPPSSGSRRSTTTAFGQTIRSRTSSPRATSSTVTGVPKGKGFSGHVKRHNFKRVHDPWLGPPPRARSIGPGTTPGRVYKGLRWPPHGRRAGDDQEAPVVRHRCERNLLLSRVRCRVRALADPREEAWRCPRRPSTTARASRSAAST